jgi:predicted HTH transcriptional regulator
MSEDTDLLNQILARMESDNVDFKRDQYHLESDQQKSAFVKDILCMANTPRSGSAYIVIGASTKNGSVENVVGSQEHPDPADFQNLVNGNTDRAVNFSCRRIRYFGVDLGLFEVPVDRSITVMARRNFGNLRKGVIYTRRNAQNAEADAHEIQRITDW